jgi:hypothetical protein
MRICKVCGGPLMFLGKLGKRLWFRCRNCGLEFSVEEEE